MSAMISEEERYTNKLKLTVGDRALRAVIGKLWGKYSNLCVTTAEPQLPARTGRPTAAWPGGHAL